MVTAHVTGRTRVAFIDLVAVVDMVQKLLVCQLAQRGYAVPDCDRLTALMVELLEGCDDDRGGEANMNLEGIKVDGCGNDFATDV